MEFDSHHLRTLFRVWQPDILLVDDEPTPSSSVEVYVEFTRRINYQLKVRPDNGTRERVISEAGDSPLVKSIRVNPYLFWNNASHQLVSEVLSSFHIPSSQRHKIIDKVISEGREIGNRVSNMGLKILPLSVEIVTFSVYTCTENAWTDYLMRESLMEGERAGSDGMVPASSSSIKALESVRMEDGGGESCTVCLEELPLGVQVTRLPCSHLFHGHCIIRWLEKSHFCPICRFEMPTQILGIH